MVLEAIRAAGIPSHAGVFSSPQGLRRQQLQAAGRSQGLRARQRRTPANPTTIYCIGWDPEGILGPPMRGGLITGLEFRRHLEKDSEAREEFNRQMREEAERRRALREARVVPETEAGLVEYFLDTEARELEYEIARLRPRLTKEFFDHLQLEVSKLKFAVSKTQDMDDRLIELEALLKVLAEGIEAYDKLQSDLLSAKDKLAKIFQSRDRKAALLELAERNELNRSVLTLLDENIASALRSNQEEAVKFMEGVRTMMLKYMTVEKKT